MHLDQNMIAEARGESLRNFTYSRIHVYYQHLSYTQSEEFSTVTIDSVLSNLGGLLGLYLGASIISIVNLIYVAVQGFLKKLNTR